MPELSAGFGTVNTHEIYDPKTGKWAQGPTVPGPARDHLGVAVVDGKIHLFGGRVADVVDNLDRHDVYDSKTNQWTTAAPLPNPRSSGAYTVLDGLILYAGGECKPGGQPFTPNTYDDVTAYNSKTIGGRLLRPCLRLVTLSVRLPSATLLTSSLERPSAVEAQPSIP